MKHLALICCALTLSACATMNKDECLVADWQAVGYQQGLKGQNAGSFEKYQKSCAKHQISADFSAFKQGHAQGINDYCTFEQGLTLGKNGHQSNNLCTYKKFPDFAEGYDSGISQYCNYANGYDLGAQSKNIPSVCPTKHYPDFASGHANGLQKYKLGQTINALQDDLDDLSEDVAIITDEIQHDEDILVSDISTSLERKEALKNTKRLKRERRELDGQYHDIEEDLIHLQKRFSDMNARR